MSSLFASLRARFMALSTGLRAGVLAILAVVVLCSVCTVCSGAIAALNGGSPTPTHAASASTSAPGAPTATQAPAKPAATATPLKPLLKLSGTGEKQSPTFHVNGQWKIAFHCDNTSSLATVPFYVNVYNSDGSSTFDTVSADCPKGGLSDETVIHDGGDKYLKVLAMSPWSLEVVDIP
jgi:hypothetical protein